MTFIVNKRILSTVCCGLFVYALSFSLFAQVAEEGTLGKQDSRQTDSVGAKPDAPENRLAKAIAGKWKVVDRIQDELDGLSESPTHNGGRVEEIQIQVMELQEFWSIRQVKEMKGDLERLAKAHSYKLLAGGQIGGGVRDRPLAYILAFYLLMERRGETSLCVISFADPGFSPWRLHHVPGKSRDKDLLFIEINREQVFSMGVAKTNRGHTCALKYAGKLEATNE